MAENLLLGPFEARSPRFGAPLSSMRAFEDDRGTVLELRGGDRYAMGWFTCPLTMEKGKWYTSRVLAEVDGITEPLYSLAAHAGGAFLDIRRAAGDVWLLEKRFQAPGDRALHSNEFRVFLRYAERGVVRYYGMEVEPAEPPISKRARIAAAMLREDGGMPDSDVETNLARTRERFSRLLSEAGEHKCDLALLPEYAPWVGLPGDHPWGHWDGAPGGPFCRMLAESARKNNMYVAAGIADARGGRVFNSLAVFGRDGRYMGGYDKTHIMFNEGEEGIACGDRYPIFEFDFGRAGATICYDQCFPEINRYYAYRGADMILHAVVGSYMPSWRADANANGLHFAASIWNRYDRRSTIIDSTGEVRASVAPEGLAIADLDFPARDVYFYGNPDIYHGWPTTHPEMRNTINGDMIESLTRYMRGEDRCAERIDV